MFQLHFGRSSVDWGQSKTNSIIQHSNSPAYENIIFRVYSSSNYFELLQGQLGSINNENDARVKRYIGGHRIKWSPNNKTNFSLGEQIIYTGVNRSFELNYLNPFIPYFFSALDGEEEAERGKGNNDNSMLFANFRHTFDLGISIYGEIIIDDFQVDDTNADNALGFKIGFDGKNIFRNNKINWLFEWVKIDPWTYLHSGEFSSWQNKKHVIGYPFGPDCEIFQLEFSIHNENGIGIYFNFYNLYNGPNNFNTEWYDGIARNKNITNEKYNFMELCLQKFYKSSVIEFGWSSIPFPNTRSMGYCPSHPPMLSTSFSANPG